MKRIIIPVNGTTEERTLYEAQKARAEAEHAKGSTGAFQKLYETLTRRYVSDDPLEPDDYRARAAGHTDVIVHTKDGRKLRMEIKYGAGTLYTKPKWTGMQPTEDAILEEQDGIIWAPYAEDATECSFPKIAHVFTRAQFISILYQMKSVKKSKGEFIVDESNRTDLGLKTSSRGVWNLPSYAICPGKQEVILQWLERTPSLEQWTENI